MSTYGKNICYIIGAGDVPDSTDIKATDGDFIICADGGFRYNMFLGRMCDLVVGDFDSLGVTPEFENKIVLPCEKDFTDMKTAVDEGLKRGYGEFVVFGALGGERADHSVANIALLSYICSKGARGRLIHENRVFLGFADSKVNLPVRDNGYISVFSLCDESREVTIKGLKYCVEKVNLRADTPYGVSNEFIGEEAEISVGNGRLLVIY